MESPGLKSYECVRYTRLGGCEGCHKLKSIFWVTVDLLK